jgi:hypothetical protein
MKLKRFDEGQWFDYPGVPGVRLKIKPICRKDFIDMKSEAKARFGGEFDFSYYEWGGMKACLIEWTGIEFEGSENPSREAMLVSIYNETGLRDFILQKAQEIFIKEQGKLDGELKNSESSQSG